MPMLLDVKRKALLHSQRVKSVDFHPTEPWLLAGLYTGHVYIWHTETGALLKTFEVTEVPIRTVRFITRKNWIVCGSDDFQVRVFNYNTQERVAAFEAHPDYIRCIAVHPTQSLILTGSDDMTIKLWDWEKGWKCIQVFEGHSHYIMNICFNPRDSNTFASACLDRTVKVWSLASPVANFSLDAHDKGVNFVEYYHGGDKPYLITTGDDRLVKVWDYHSKSCVQSLEGHTSNVSFAIFHPFLPIIVSGSEDGTVKIWHSSTYRLENTLNYGLERAWCIAYSKGGNDVAFGFDEGAVVVKLGKEEPSMSMDSAGKVVFAKNAEIFGVNLQTLQDEPYADGSNIPVPKREMGTTEVYAQTLLHSPNGRFVTVCGDGEYIVYTSLAWRNKAFGSGLGFAWSVDSNTYAVRETPAKIKIFRNFKERPGLIKNNYAIDEVWGGQLLAVKGSNFVVFYDWETGDIVRRIDVDVKSIMWSESGNFVTIVTEESFYILKYNRAAFDAYVDGGNEIEDEGVAEAFDISHEISESVSTARWSGDCFIYINSANRLNYFVGGQTHTIAHFDRELYLLGFLSSHNRVYVCDKDVRVYGYSLSLSVIEYQSAILNGNLDAAKDLLSSIPSDQINKIARFLDSQNMKEAAYEITHDEDHKFELAVYLDKLDEALSLARNSSAHGSEQKWRDIGDKALSNWQIELAEECFKRAADLSTLLLIYTSTANRQGLIELASQAVSTGQNNIAFACYLSLGSTESSIDTLLATDRAPEAAFFARTYAPSQVSRTLQAWKESLSSSRKNINLADPEVNPEAFGEWKEILEKEKSLDAGVTENETGLEHPIKELLTLNGSSTEQQQPQETE